MWRSVAGQRGLLPVRNNPVDFARPVALAFNLLTVIPAKTSHGGACRGGVESDDLRK